MLHRSRLFGILYLVMGLPGLAVALVKHEWLLAGTFAALACTGAALLSERTAMISLPLHMSFLALLLVSFTVRNPADPVIRVGAALAIAGTALVWLVLPLLLVARSRNRRQSD